MVVFISPEKQIIKLPLEDQIALEFIRMFENDRDKTSFLEKAWFYSIKQLQNSNYQIMSNELNLVGLDDNFEDNNLEIYSFSFPKNSERILRDLIKYHKQINTVKDCAQIPLKIYIAYFISYYNDLELSQHSFFRSFKDVENDFLKYLNSSQKYFIIDPNQFIKTIKDRKTKKISSFRKDSIFLINRKPQ